MPPSDRGPGVPFPPPLIFLAGFGLAWLLDARIEFLIAGDGPGPLQDTVGLALVAAGLLLMAWGIVTFTRARTAVMPMSRARALVRRGPYRFTRNPMYVGLTCAYVGFAIVANMVWPILLLPLVLAALVALVIRREEAYLQAEFGDEYDAYRREVRRWL